MKTLELVLVSALTFSLTSCIPMWSDDITRRGPEDFEVTGTLTRTLADCSTTYELSNVGDAAPSCYKCAKFQTGATTAPLAFVLSLDVSQSSCEQPLLLGSTPLGFSYADDGGANVHMFDWNEPKSFAAWKDLGTGDWTGDEYVGQVSAGALEDPVTRAQELSLDIAWDVDQKLSRTLQVCPDYEGEETEVSYSWLGDNVCDEALNCGSYSFDGGDCEPVGFGDDDDSVDPPVCDDDAAEENDTPDDATPVPGSGTIEGMKACAGDRDFFILPAATGQDVQIELTFLHGNGDIDVRLLDRDLAELSVGTTADDNEVIWWTTEQPGPLYIEVFLFEGDPSPGNAYTLRAYAN